MDEVQKSSTGIQCWEGYFGKVTDYKLPYLKCNKLCNYFNYFINVTDYIWLLFDYLSKFLMNVFNC